MSETLDPVAMELDQRQLAEQLLAQAKEQGVELVGPNGLLNQLTKNVLETALDAEMAEHLGYDKHDPAGRGSGTPATTPGQDGAHRDRRRRDRSASRHQQQLRAADCQEASASADGYRRDRIVTTAKGLTTGEVAAHFADVYGATVSKDTISRITDKVVAEMTDWCNRPLVPGRIPLIVANQ